LDPIPKDSLRNMGREEINEYVPMALPYEFWRMKKLLGKTLEYALGSIL